MSPNGLRTTELRPQTCTTHPEHLLLLLLLLPLLVVVVVVAVVGCCCCCRFSASFRVRRQPNSNRRGEIGAAMWAGQSVGCSAAYGPVCTSPPPQRPCGGARVPFYLRADYLRLEPPATALPGPPVRESEVVWIQSEV